MKMILTSTDFLTPNSRKTIISELGNISKCKILFIPNEKATQDKIKSSKYYDRLIEYGFVRENIFVFNPVNPEKFSNLNINAIYIGGGNTFWLLKMLKDTKFDLEIIKYVNNGVIYVGGSAGTHIVTKTISHLTDFDRNDVNLLDFDGLSLYDGIIICHYSAKRRYIYTKLSKSFKNVTRLKDDEYIIINN